MDYKNLLTRSLITIIFLIIYSIIIIQNNILILYLISLIYLLLIIEVLLFFNNLKNIFLTYILLSLICFILYHNNYFNILEFHLFILSIIAFDISSYLFGSIFGKKKIIEKISPNKTYTGLILGILTSNFISFIYIKYYYRDLLIETPDLHQR